MKKSLQTAVVLLLCLAGCSELEQPEGEKYAEDIQITVNTDLSDTKTILAPDGAGGYTSSWREFDRFRIHYQESGEAMSGSSVTLVNSSADGAKASFSGSTSLTAGTSYTLRGYYPSSSFAHNLQANRAKYPTSVALTVPTVQSPTVTSVDPLSDILIAEPVEITLYGSSINVSTRFARATAVAKIVFKDPEGIVSGETFDRITFETSSTAVAGAGIIDLSYNGGFTGDFLNGSDGGGSGEKKITACFESFTIDSSTPVLLSLIPCTIPAGERITFRAYGEHHTISKTIILNSDLIFNPGRLKTINVSIDELNILENITLPDVSASSKFRIMSFNIHNSSISEASPFRWSDRKAAIVACIKDLEPDVIGMQELVSDQKSDLVEQLSSSYDFHQSSADSYHDGIIYKKGYTMLDQGVISFSELGDASCNTSQTCTWAKMQSPSGKIFWFAATHLPANQTGKESELRTLRLACAEKIVTELKTIVPSDATLFLTGDMNSSNWNYYSNASDRASITPFYTWFEDAREASETVVGNCSLNAFGKYDTKADMNVDMIYFRNVASADKFVTETRPFNGIRYISDHYPVYFDCCF